MHILGPAILKALEKVYLQVNGSMNMSLFLFNYSLDALYFTAYSMNFNKSYVTLEDGKFNMSIKDLSLALKAFAQFTTVPALFYGRGYGMFNLSRMNSSTAFSLDIGNNLLPTFSLDYSHFNLSEKDLSMSFNGTNDVFTLLNSTQDLLIPTITGMLNGTMKPETRKSISDTINDLLSGLPSNITIPGTNINFDFGFIENPSMKGKYLPIALKGVSKCVNTTACKPYKKRTLIPPKEKKVFDGNGSLQILVSDYLINTLSFSAFEDQMMNLKVSSKQVSNMTNNTIKLDTDLFGIFIPHMRELYGKKREININFNITDPPMISIATDAIRCKIFSVVKLYSERKQRN